MQFGVAAGPIRGGWRLPGEFGSLEQGDRELDGIEPDATEERTSAKTMRCVRTTVHLAPQVGGRLGGSPLLLGTLSPHAFEEPSRAITDLIPEEMTDRRASR